MITVVIVDDEAPARAKLRRWLEEQSDIDIVAEAADGPGAARAIATHAPDFVLLDIQMPGISGLELAAQLESGAAPVIVFVTAFDEHAVRAFDLNAVDYLLKPYDQERFLRMLERVRARLKNREDRSRAVATARSRSTASERLLVPEGESLHMIDSSSILWIEADDNYLRVHTAARHYLLRRTLRDLLLQLGEQRFVQIHKSTAVNIAEIRSLDPLFKGDYEIQLRSGERLRLSRRYRQALFDRTGR
ncbi:MAG: hypothetical protein JWQ90_731 [Hydrocarboniphaga sp.]|uniref:LytR/AlgR family response regulator transcription factor n=1 Tax=Hydrocarboniphaga sp. TaxID=2033016 RepID=UPI002634B5B7|nr:response regulator [Hydrocarboniphaga sp.]MDB5968281.1 hypothetical protein [Hydrocarboniphaga sp.]